MVEKGYAASTQDAFTRFLGDGKPGYVPHRWAKLEDASGGSKARAVRP